jgi:hypothetical protein
MEMRIVSKPSVVSNRLVSVFFCSLCFSNSGLSQQREWKIALTTTTTVPVADLSRELGVRCPNVKITIDAAKADFTMEVVGGNHSAPQKELRNFKLALFDRDGTAVFSSSTHGLGNAIKDVCGYTEKAKGASVGATANSDPLSVADPPVPIGR